jgi:hypothetical protein
LVDDLLDKSLEEPIDEFGEADEETQVAEVKDALEEEEPATFDISGDDAAIIEEEPSVEAAPEEFIPKIIEDA